MNRLLYWIRNIFDKDEMHCSHFCVTCKYFDRCEEDFGTKNVYKAIESTNSPLTDRLKKAS